MTTQAKAASTHTPGLVDTAWYDAIIAAKARARLNNRGVAYAIRWADGHCTIADQKPSLRSREMRVLECDSTGAEYLA